MVPLKHSIATKLLKIVFTVYLVLTITVTSILMMAEYIHTREQVIEELQRIEFVFRPTLSRALWEMNFDQVRSALLGLERLPAVIGFQVMDNKENTIAKAGKIIKSDGVCVFVGPDGKETVKKSSSGLFWHEFNLTFSRGDKVFDVGRVRIYSSNSVVFNKVQLNLIFLLINAVITTVALWAIILYVFRRILLLPLSQLTEATREIDLDNLENVRINVQTSPHNELKVMESAFQDMVDKLLAARQRLNDYMRTEKEKLEVLVAKRTNELARSEEKYRQSEAELKAIFASMTDIILVFDKNGKCLEIAPSSPNLLFKPSQEILNKTFHEVFPIEKADRFLEVIKTSLSKRATVEIEYDLTIDEKQLWFDGRVSPISEDTAILVARDITVRRQWELELEQAKYEAETANKELHREIAERKRVERDLRDSEHQLRLITDNSPAYIAYVGIDDLKYKFVNRKFEIAYNRTDIVGHHIRDIIGEANYQHALPYIEMVRKGQAVTYENVFPVATGKRWIQVNYVPDLNEDGEVRAIVVVSHDITDLKNTEEVLRENEQLHKELYKEANEAKELYRSLLESTPDSIVMYDMDGWVTYVNDAFVQTFGWTLDELTDGVPYTPESEREATMQKVYKVIRDGEPVSYFETKRLTKSGGLVDVSLSASRFYDHNGNPSGMLVILRDISANVFMQKQLEEAKEDAERANKAKSAFLANMSHELRTPLNAILGFSQLMMRDPDVTQEQLASLKTICRSGEHLLTLINDVLEFSKIEAGQLSLKPLSFDLYQLLLNLEDMFWMRAQDKGLSLVFKREEGVPRFIQADQGKLSQVLINLLANALKFTNHGTISLRISKIEQEEEQANQLLLAFEVSDQGIGMSPEVQEKIFNTFYQADDQLLAKQGTGLGLSISQKFVALMGGKLRVTSQEGRGACFSFAIPVEQTREADAELSLQKRRVVGLAPDQEAFRLLVVDDNENSRNLMVRLLRSVGFEARSAENGQQAFEKWEQWRPHLIWMDMRMPVMDGYEATEKIKNAPGGENCAIIALTASAFEEDRLKVIEHGCDDFVRKPFKESEIFSMMQKYLGVRYEYQKAADCSLRYVTAMPDERMAESIRTIPGGLLAKLREAVELSDVNKIEEVIAEIREKYKDVAEALSGLAENFSYDKILALIPKAED